MPATGWNQRFDARRRHAAPAAGSSADRRARAPTKRRIPGSSAGACGVCSAWRWSWCSSTGRAGLVPAAIAAVALLLTYQEMPPLIWLWGNLLAALAMARAAPEGRFRKFARAYRTLSFVVLGLALLPFMWMQVRFALYPQLEIISAWTIRSTSERTVWARHLGAKLALCDRRRGGPAADAERRHRGTIGTAAAASAGRRDAEAAPTSSREPEVG